MGRGFPAVLATLAGLTLLSACEQAEQPPTVPAATEVPRSVVVAVAEELSGFNVHVPRHAGQAARDVVGRIWPSAYRILPDGTYAPSLLARSAKVVSDEPTVLEWQIKAEADWSDGTPVTSADAEYLWRQCSAPEADAVCAEAARYRRIVSFETVDEKRFRTTFEGPASGHELLFRMIPPSHVGSRRPGGWERAFDADPGASAGPFRFDEWRRGEHLVLVANDRWFGPRPDLERLTFAVTEAREMVDALRSGDVDVAVPPPTLPTVRALLDLPQVDVQFGAAPELELLSFNLAHPVLADPAVRRAALLALDRHALVESLAVPLNPDAQRVDNRLVPSRHPAYQAYGEAFAQRDPGAARAALADAGFTETPEGGWERDGEPLEMQITTTSGVARREQLVQLVQSQLGEVGFRLHIDNVPLDELDRLVTERDFDILVWPRRTQGSSLATAQAAYGCDGPLNASGLCDDAVDQQVSDAGAATGPADEAELLNALDATLWELLPDAPIYETPVVMAHDASLGGVALNATAEGHLWNVETWTVPPYAGG